MDEIRIVLLAIIQGITEFLPISSSGHLVLFEYLFGISKNDIVIEIVLHFGTLISILIYFRRDLANLLGGVFSLKSESISYCGNILLATLPIVLVVIFFKDNIESIFSINILVYTYLVNMIILYSTKGKISKNQNISYRLALIMGVAQIFALFPGISRAGITICAGLLVGASQNAVARFSFFMAIPALLGAIAFELDNIIIAIETEPSVILLGLIFSMTTGLLALKLLFKVLQKQNLWIFAYYCLFIWLIITTIVYNG